MLNVITNIWNEKQLYRARKLFFSKTREVGDKRISCLRRS